MSQCPFVLLVSLDIFPDRVQEFLNVMEIDATGSRTEPGCLVFDLIRDQTDPNKFYFYEVYVDAEAVNFHKTTPHYQKWSEFKASGGVKSFQVVKGDAVLHDYKKVKSSL